MKSGFDCQGLWVIINSISIKKIQKCDKYVPWADYDRPLELLVSFDRFEVDFVQEYIFEVAREKIQ